MEKHPSAFDLHWKPGISLALGRPQDVTAFMSVPQLKSLAPGTRLARPVLRAEQVRVPSAAALGLLRAGGSLCVAAAARLPKLCWFAMCWKRKAAILAHGKVGHRICSKSCFGGGCGVPDTLLCTMGGFPDPSWPSKPALQLCITGVRKVALLLVRIRLQGVMLA